LLCRSVQLVTGIRNLLEKENKFHFGGSSENIQDVLRNFDSENANISSNKLLFIDDHNYPKTSTIDLLNQIRNNIFAHEIKTIVYTDSFDVDYLDKIILANTAGLIHKKETPLPGSRNNLQFNTSYYVRKSNKLYVKSFLHKLRLISCGSIHYDSLVVSILLNRYAWARGDTDYYITGETLLKEGDKSTQFTNLLEGIFLDPEKIINLLTHREEEVMLCIADRKNNGQIAIELFLSNRTIETHKTKIMHKCSFKSIYDI